MVGRYNGREGELKTGPGISLPCWIGVVVLVQGKSGKRKGGKVEKN
jgi:hypothetical protein